jgi:hypothetical protein
MDNTDAAKVVGLALGLLVVLLLNNWLYPNDLANTIVAVLAAP